MAQSRPPPVRTYSVATSPPPLSPRTHTNSEKKHHSRRKSGKDYVVSEKKSTRPAPLSRRTTPQHTARLATGRNSHRDRDEDVYAGRDSGESFPQFCMTCEKQFLPANNTFLYCSEACRAHDQAPSQPIRSNSYSSSPPLTPYANQFSYPSTTTYEDGPDIIPRFSPTQSRPRSYFNSDPYPQSYQPSTTYSSSPQTQYNTSSSSTALASLRELATALPKSSKSSSRSHKNRSNDPESPPKSNASSITRTGSGVWDYIPFTSSSKTATPTPSATPGNSYSNTKESANYGNGGYGVSQSYGAAGRSKEDLQSYGNAGYGYGYGKSHGTGGFGSTGGMGMDRPLPPRTAGHRPKSVDLVTPFSGH
ncbi:hypothetical protein VTL71DRAFT_4871 [Oculimacula yallundae]|uniref:Life-span regulatory factor domain-containing protein n=1 Tax=Oculimacula yallundae TaxID=86028 RepID=A0ABR4C3V1_9HELO